MPVWLSRWVMFRSRSAVFAIVLLLLAAAPAAARSPDARTEHQRIVNYWTAERLRTAIPRERVVAPARQAPAARPDGKGPGGGGNGNVTGASWTKGGLILKASGKVFFTLGGSNWTCSGSVAQDSRTSYSLVMSAAHCAVDETTGEFATNWIFIPEYDSAPSRTCANTTHGCWTARALVVHQGYATAGSFNTQATVHDYAFAVVAEGGKTGTAQLDATAGSFPIQFGGVSAGDRLYAFGYPAAGKYKGNDLTYCAGPIFTDSWNDDLTWGMACTMTGGSSGGPWLASFDEATGTGVLSSLNSYGYSGVKNMYGPKFDHRTAAVYSSADAATANTVVP
ncbi:MAG TPA: hypothetical protein VNW68_06230 [Candidatus Limnocylindria bacterium]|jgi:hypothetical protein|nr:hypothetical protein [Candidatus Limnocylindria bacterium]